MKIRLFTLGATFCILLAAPPAQAITLEQLQRDATLTPETFARHFSRFKFEFHTEVQKPEDFLSIKAGDCDDYSTLADSILTQHGYHTRLISVRTRNIIHVVCYVTEANGYLDYNLRARGTGLVHCGNEVGDIAEAVAKSLKAPWTSASEFTFDGRVKRLVKTVLPSTQTTPIVAAAK